MSVLSEKEKHMYIGMITTPMNPERLVEEVEEATLDAVVRMIEEFETSHNYIDKKFLEEVLTELINKLKESDSNG